MKNQMELNKLGLVELNQKEIVEIEGGKLSVWAAILGVVAAVESVFTAVESDFTASVVSLGFLELQAAATTMATTAERIIILFFISKLWLKFGLNQKMLSG